jgi:hypothetical protein
MLHEEKLKDTRSRKWKDGQCSGQMRSRRLCPRYMATVTIPRKNNVRFISNPICFVEDSCIFMLFVFIYTGGQHDFRIRWCSCRLA